MQASCPKVSALLLIDVAFITSLANSSAGTTVVSAGAAAAPSVAGAVCFSTDAAALAPTSAAAAVTGAYTTIRKIQIKYDVI